MAKDQEDNSGFVVKDRRRFDSSGNVRDGEVSGESKTRASAPASAAGASKPKEKEVRPAPGAGSAGTAKTVDPGVVGAEAGEVNFSSFLMSLATQALMQLGQIEPPPGVSIEIDRAAAKQTIDILGMLRTKTRGNLDPQEAALIEEIVASLQMSFVKSK